MFLIRQEGLIGAENCTLLKDEASAVNQPSSTTNSDLIAEVIDEQSADAISR